MKDFKMIFLYPLLSNNHEQNPLHMQISPLSEETFNILSNVIKDLNTVITRRHSLKTLHYNKRKKYAFNLLLISINIGRDYNGI